MSGSNVVMRTIALVVVSLFACSAAAGQKTPDVRVDTRPAGSAQSLGDQVAASGSAVYVTWVDDRNGGFPGWDIYFNRSLDRGATWLASDVRLDTDAPGAAHSADARIAASGTSVYVTWEDQRSGRSDVYFNRSLDRGTTWLASDVRLDTDPAGAATSDDPRIAAAGTSVYVTWSDHRNGNTDIYVNRSLDGGLTWLSSDVRVDTDTAGAASSFRPEIAAAGSTVYVVWQDLRNGLSDVYFNRSLDGGLTWLSSDVRVDTDPSLFGTASDPQIAAVGASVYVAWYDDRNGSNRQDIYFNRSLDGGLTWLPSDVRLDTSPAGTTLSFFPRIAAEGSGVYVTWYVSTGYAYNRDIYFNRSLDQGTTWLGSSVRLDTDAPFSGNSTRPEIAVSGSSVYVTWYDRRNGASSDDVYFNRSPDRGTTWLSSDVRLDTDPAGSAGSYDPQIAAAGSSVYVTWTDVRNGSGDVYFNIPFGFQPYGSATPGSGGSAPQLGSIGAATIGSMPSIDVTNGLGGASGALFLGTSKTSLPLLGGTLLVVPALSVPVALSPGGAATLPLLLPNTESVIGVNIDFQGVFLDAGAPQGLSMTNGIEMWIG